MALLLAAGAAQGQAMYKIVTPDGKVVYSDKPPAQGQASVQQLQRPQPGGAPAAGPGAVVAPMPGGPFVDIVPGVAAPPHGAILGALRGSKEMNEANECVRANAAALSLMKAAEELIRTVSNLKASGAKGASAHQNDLLERQWKYYKSLGGPAATPEQARMPEDPCKKFKEALQKKSAALEAQYRECIASHPNEVKLSALSRELASNRRYLAMLEKIQNEKTANPQSDSGFKGSGEWAAAFKADPALVRARLAAQFQQYRSAGGPASRIEEVTEIPDPCTPEASTTPRRSPITARRALALPGQ